jgi:hypothetical protein
MPEVERDEFVSPTVRWEITHVNEPDARRLGENGWEPFAVTRPNMQSVVWFKRQNTNRTQDSAESLDS